MAWYVVVLRRNVLYAVVDIILCCDCNYGGCIMTWNGCIIGNPSEVRLPDSSARGNSWDNNIYGYGRVMGHL